MILISETVYKACAESKYLEIYATLCCDLSKDDTIQWKEPESDPKAKPPENTKKSKKATKFKQCLLQKIQNHFEENEKILRTSSTAHLHLFQAL